MLPMLHGLIEEDPDELPRTDAKLEQMFRDLEEKPDWVQLYLIELGSEVVGYVLLIFGYSTELGGKFAEIEELYILSEYRGKGIGSSVIRKLEKVIDETDANSTVLVATENNIRAMNLYERLGYEPLGMRQTYVKFKVQ